MEEELTEEQRKKIGGGACLLGAICLAIILLFWLALGSFWSGTAIAAALWFIGWFILMIKLQKDERTALKEPPIRLSKYSSDRLGFLLGIATVVCGIIAGGHYGMAAGIGVIVGLLILWVAIVVLLLKYKLMAKIEEGTLGKCRDCAQMVSLMAKTCPHCGVEEPASNELDRTIKSAFGFVNKLFWGVTILVVLVAAAGFLTNPNENSLRSHVLDGIRSEGGEAKAVAADAFLTTKYENFYLFSLGSSRFPTDDAASVYIGAFGHWIPYHAKAPANAAN